jgi:hypothetical protein
MPDSTAPTRSDATDTPPSCTAWCWLGHRYDPNRDPREVARLIQADLVHQGLPARVTIRHGRGTMTGEVYLMVRLALDYRSSTHNDVIREAVWAYGRARRHGTAQWSRPFHVARLSVPRERGAGGAVISPPLTSVVSTTAQAVEPQRRTA